MSAWHFVDADGQPTGATFSGPAHRIAANTPEGCTAVEGMPETAPRADPELIRSRIMERMEALERSQARPLRELALDPTDENARARLAKINAEIEKVRLFL